MSEILIIECDYGDGECLERFDGFMPNIDDTFRKSHLHIEGWLVQDDKHYCPKHKEQALKEKP